MQMDANDFIPARQVAAQLGLPLSWVQAEARAGRLPHLKVGRSLFFDLDVVRTALRERAADNSANRVSRNVLQGLQA
jgi:hypothetical protein